MDINDSLYVYSFIGVTVFYFYELQMSVFGCEHSVTKCCCLLPYVGVDAVQAVWYQTGAVHTCITVVVIVTNSQLTCVGIHLAFFLPPSAAKSTPVFYS